MADIAMLVAEEHEKRMKRGAPRAVAGAEEEASEGRVNFGAVTKVWGSWAESAAAAAASGVKVHVAVLVKSDLVAADPKSPVARAAFDGFFSA